MSNVGEDTIEKIAGVAVLFPEENYFISLPWGCHHIDALMFCRGKLNVRQGFVTSTGRFLDRKGAWEVAQRAGQVVFHEGIVEGRLHSEDLF